MINANGRSVFSHRLEIVTNVATIVALLVFGTMIIKKQYFPSRQPNLGVDPQVGAELGTIRGVDLHSRGKTLLVAISSQCKFCRESLPFYRNLERKSAGGTGVRLVFLHPEADLEFENFLSKNEIVGVPIVPADFKQLNIMRTPVILSVDSGKINHVWVGKLRESEEGEVLSALR